MTVSDFAPHVGDEFVVGGYPDGPPVSQLKLVNAAPGKIYREGERESFTLDFEGPASVPLNQQLVTLEHPVLGKLDIFIVPVRGDTETRVYEAVFN